MSTATTSSERAPPSQARRQNALSLLFFLCMALALLVRIAVSPQLMNMVVRYTDDSGAFYEKLHFGTLAIFVLFPFVLFSRPILLRGSEIGLFKVVLTYTALMAALVVYLIATGRPGSSGFIIDSYLVAGATGLMMLALNADAKRALGGVVLTILILSAAIATGEAVTQHRLLPYDLVELQFRPIGLSMHPLSLGALCATAIGFVPLTRWPIWVRILAILILFVGCAASGARTALILTVAEILVLLLFLPWRGLALAHERQAKFVTLFLVMIAGGAIIAIMFAAGLMSRFGSTIFDENFMARVTIYNVFDFVSWKELLFGMNADDLLRIVNEQLNLPTIESAPVVITLLLGAPLAVLFAIFLFRFLLRLLWGAPLPAWIGSLTFLLAALSNNALSSKAPDITIVVVLLLAFRGEARRGTA